MKPSVYREKNGNMSYTRTEYMGGIPGSKIVRFTMGNSEGDFTHTVELVNTKAGQIRHNALEAARVAALRHMERRIERDKFHLKIIPYPHQVLREHKRVNVAQADRFQEGMKKAYGKPVAMAARVNNRDTIMIAEVNELNLDTARKALERAQHKLPLPIRMIIKEN